MRFLALLLLAPCLAIFVWLYWAWPRSMPRTRGRRGFDLAVLLLAVLNVVQVVMLGFDTASLPVDGPLGRHTGGIWQQVLPALYAYGAFTATLFVGAGVRHLAWGRGRSA